MSRKLTIELPDEVYEPLMKAAERVGRTPEDYLAAYARQMSASWRAKSAPVNENGLTELLKFAGCVSLSENSADNEQIDRDLAKEYADTHDEEK